MCKLIAIQIVNRYKVASFFDSIFHGETHLLIKRFAGILKIEFIFTHKQVACFFGDYAIFIQSIGYSRPFFVSGRIKQRKHNIAPIIAVVLKLVFKEGLAVHLGEFVVEVSGFCAGFRGTGPYNLLNCLRATGIDENLLSDEIVYDDRMVIVKEDWKRETAEYGSFRSTDVL